MKTKNLFRCLGVASRAAWAHLGLASREAWVLPTLLAVLNLLPAGRVTAQTFTTLHNFTSSSGSFPWAQTNSDGAVPQAGLILLGNTLYGTAQYGGSSGRGTVFAINTDGAGFTNLYIFTSLPAPYFGTNSDGAYPSAELILSGNTVYGTAEGGGSSGNGTVFAVNTDGTGFTNLHSFTARTGSYPYTNSEGAVPAGGLVLSGNALYGTAYYGGSSGNGTVFAVNTDGSGFTNLHSFTGYPDGAFPYSGLVLSGNILYGTTSEGGGPGNGTVFALNTDGSGFTNLHSFTATPDPLDTNSDGAFPRAGLFLSGNTLYGTAQYGGSSGFGTVFAINTDGSGFTNLHSFTGYPSEGGSPIGGLILSGSTLYGTTSGAGDYSAVFAVNTDGTGFTSLHSFAAATTNSSGAYTNSGGVNPSAGLILSGNTLYGTASAGGSSGNGTVFSLSFPPRLTITFPGDYPVLSWPTNVAGFDYSGYHLQYTRGTNLPAVWVNLVYAPTIVNGQYSVTVPWTLFLTQSSSSFRLRQ